MFRFRKKKTVIKELDNYIIELSDEKVSLYTKAPLWRVEYMSTTTPYALFSAMWDDDSTLEGICLFLQTNLSMVSNGKYVSEVLKIAMESIGETTKPTKVSKSEDEAILREVQVLHDQSEESVAKHIEATEPKKRRKKNDDRKSKSADR